MSRLSSILTLFLFILIGSFQSLSASSLNTKNFESGDTSLVIDGLEELAAQAAQLRFGLHVGLNIPYNADLSILLGESVDLSAGVGINMSPGLIFGTGLRYYMKPNRRLSPMLAGYFTRFSGSDQSNSGGSSSSGDNKGVFKFPAVNSFIVNGGIRFEFSKERKNNFLILNVGYSFNMADKEPELLSLESGTYSKSLKDFVNLFYPGGVSASVGWVMSFSTK